MFCIFNLHVFFSSSLIPFFSSFLPVLLDLYSILFIPISEFLISLSFNSFFESSISVMLLPLVPNEFIFLWFILICMEGSFTFNPSLFFMLIIFISFLASTFFTFSFIFKFWKVSCFSLEFLISLLIFFSSLWLSLVIIDDDFDCTNFLSLISSTFWIGIILSFSSLFLILNLHVLLFSFLSLLFISSIFLYDLLVINLIFWILFISSFSFICLLISIFCNDLLLLSFPSILICVFICG